MKFTKNSKILMDFFFHNKCINHVPLTNKTKQILQKMFPPAHGRGRGGLRANCHTRVGFWYEKTSSHGLVGKS